MSKDYIQLTFDTAIETTLDRGFWGLGLEHYMGGHQAFFWVEDQKKFIDLMRQYVDWVWNEAEPEEKYVKLLNDLIDQFERGLIHAQQFGVKLEEHFSTFLVLWCGSFDDFISSDLDSARSVRAKFWDDWSLENDDEDYEEGQNQSAISDEFIEEFARHITGERL